MSGTEKYDVFALFLPAVKELIAKRDFTTLKDFLRNINSIDLALGWPRLEGNEKILVFKLLTQRKAVEVFEQMHFDEQSFLLDNLNSDEVMAVLNEMAPDERSRLFKDLPKEVMKKFLGLLRTEEANNVKALMTYRNGTAGGIMTTDFVIIKKDMSAKKALISLQENLLTSQARDIHSVYVTDKDDALTGMVNLQALLRAPQDILVKDIISGVEEVKIKADAPRSEVVKKFSKYNLLDAPVVDAANRLVGVITVDDIVDLMEKRATRDMYEVGKMAPSGGEIISYQTASVKELLGRRAGWLIALLLFDFLTGTVLKTFESSLSAVVALAFFIPMLLDTGGNAGAQVSITMIRGLATGDVSFRNVWKVVKLEFKTAFFMAAIVAGIALGRALLLQKDLFVSAVVSATMFIIVLVAIATGVILPLLSKRVGLDPAALAGPITTSIVDVIGLIIYFKIAQHFIPLLKAL